MPTSALLLAATTAALGAVTLMSPPAARAVELRQEAAAVIKVAHRGGIEPGYPENTLRAYRRAIALGADVIEIDLRATRDGAVVIIHDDSVDRTTNGRGRVAELSLEELRRFDAGQGERVPTLAEALQTIAGSPAKLLLDVKPSPQLDKESVVKLIEARRQTLDVVVGARSLDDLREFRRLNRNLRVLGFIKEVHEVDDFIASGADVIRLWPEWIDANPDLVRRIQQRHRAVWATCVDDSPEAIERLIAAGVDGVIADRVTILSSVLGANGAADGDSIERGGSRHNAEATTRSNASPVVELQSREASRQ